MEEIIESEQEKRDPINLTDFVLTDAMKEVLRLGATFAPTLTQQIDTYNLYIDFQRWADNLRWQSKSSCLIRIREEKLTTTSHLTSGQL